MGQAGVLEMKNSLDEKSTTNVCELSELVKQQDAEKLKSGFSLSKEDSC